MEKKDIFTIMTYGLPGVGKSTFLNGLHDNGKTKKFQSSNQPSACTLKTQVQIFKIFNSSYEIRAVDIPGICGTDITMDALKEDFNTKGLFKTTVNVIFWIVDATTKPNLADSIGKAFIDLLIPGVQSFKYENLVLVLTKCDKWDGDDPTDVFPKKEFASQWVQKLNSLLQQESAMQIKESLAFGKENSKYYKQDSFWKELNTLIATLTTQQTMAMNQKISDNGLKQAAIQVCDPQKAQEMEEKFNVKYLTIPEVGTCALCKLDVTKLPENNYRFFCPWTQQIICHPCAWQKSEDKFKAERFTFPNNVIHYLPKKPHLKDTINRKLLGLNIQPDENQKINTSHECVCLICKGKMSLSRWICLVCSQEGSLFDCCVPCINISMKAATTDKEKEIKAIFETQKHDSGHPMLRINYNFGYYHY